MAETRAQSNKRIRQEALREQLSQGKHVEHVIDMLKNLEEPPKGFKSLDLQRIKVIIDTKLALIKKYLPDPKQVELSGDPESPIAVSGMSTKELEAIIARSQG
jgi:hypothetical protein